MSEKASLMAASSLPTVPYTIWQMNLYALKLGSIGFGGPVALIGYMYRDLVEDRKWISEAEYREGLTLAQLAPGPLAAQLAIYIGYCHYGVLGATLVGVAFAMPSFLMVVVLGWAYLTYEGLVWMQAVFYGVGACVIGIIARSAQKLTQKTLRRHRFRWCVFLVMAVVTYLTEYESIPLILAAGIMSWAIHTICLRMESFETTAQSVAMALLVTIAVYISFQPFHAPQSVETIQSEAATDSILMDLFWYFAQAGAFVFGSGLAIVPFLFGGVVKEYQWLNDRQFMDAVAVAMITPGPVVITTGFIGYLVAGLKGATVAAFATFFPCYLFTIVLAPLMRRYGKRPGVVALVDGVTAGAIGAIAGSVLVLGKRSIIDVPTLLIAVTAYLVLLKGKQVPEPILILLAAICGLILHGWR